MNSEVRLLRSYLNDVLGNHKEVNIQIEKLKKRSKDLEYQEQKLRAMIEFWEGKKNV